MDFEKVGCEEFYNDGEQLNFDMELDLAEPVLLLSPNLLMVAYVRNGRLIRTVGTTIKAEQIEMDYVKITKHGEDPFFVKIGPNVRWMEAN